MMKDNNNNRPNGMYSVYVSVKVSG